MKRKEILSIHHAQRDDIDDLITFRAMPVQGLSDLNPFLFLNHHGPQNYPENNHGLPFGPHPHRGFETVTFILAGDIAHRDSTGTESVIMDGGIQWMTAGRGIVHSEISSEHFKRAGGPMEILQLWVNLPARLKMSEPWYLGLQKHQLPEFERDSGRVHVKLVSGKWEDNLGPVPTIRPATTMLVSMKDNASYAFQIPANERIFFYVISGFVNVNGTKAGPRETVTFSGDGELLEVTSEKGGRVLLCHAPPLDEPIASYGPFVMNTTAEIQEAIRDFQAGKFQ
ncbi:MAG: pirin family protein [Bacteriovoracaceae bacterium]